MKSTFFEYYALTSAELKSLWDEALIVFDSNVLLEAYSLPKEGQDALLDLLRSLNDRLWIPHHVGLEFQRNRLRAVGTARDKTDKALGEAKSSIGKVVSRLEGLRLQERGIGVDPKAVFASLDASLKLACESIEKAHSALPALGLVDEIRDQIDEIFSGRIGPPLASQQALDAIFKEGANRYASNIPPGFSDLDKGEGSYGHAGLVYQFKYGDLVVWKQLIEHLKSKEIKKLIFVTLDSKEDWWAKKGDVVAGPRPELLRELREVGGIDLGWMFGLTDFMSLSNRYLSEKISATALGQVQAAEEQRADLDQFRQVPSTDAGQSLEFRPGDVDVTSGRSADVLLVRRWMINNGAQKDAISLVDEDYDVVVRDRYGRKARYDVVVCNAPTRSAFLSIANRLDRLKSRLSLLGMHGGALGLIVIFYAEDMNDLARAIGKANQLGQDMGVVSSAWDVELVVGVAFQGAFTPAFHHNPLDSSVSK